MVFKIICLVLISVCAGAFMLTPKFISEKKYKNSDQRIKLIVRIRLGFFLAMMILLLICLFIR